MLHYTGVYNIPAYTRSVQVKLSVMKEEQEIDVYIVLKPWTAVGHTEPTWFNNSS